MTRGVANYEPNQLISIFRSPWADWRGELGAVDEIAYRRAMARIEARFAFYRHVMLYAVINFFLFVLNLVRNPHHLWFQWVMLGWGIGLLAHGLNVFSYRWFGSHRDEMIRREMERQARSG